MPFRKRLLAALLVASTLTACASSTPRQTAQPRVLPAEYATRCPPPVRAADNGSDAMAIALHDMYELYGVCAGRLVDLVDWVNGGAR